MAASKSKLSVPLRQAARRNNRRATDRHPDRSGSSAERRNQIRSTSKADQPSHNNPRAANRHSRHSKNLVHFPETRGKVVKDVEFYTGSDSSALALRFEDNTSLAFDFATGFATEAHFSHWKDGNERVLRYWPRINCEPIF